jgi:hypothetical protein
VSDESTESQHKVIALTTGLTQGKGKVGPYLGNPGTKPFGSAFTLGACKTVFHGRTKRRNPGSAAQVHYRRQFSELTKYYKTALPSGIRANWEAFAAANQFVTQRQKSVLTTNGLIYWLSYAISSIDFGTGGDLDADPSIANPLAVAIMPPGYYAAGNFVFPNMITGCTATGADVLYVYATQVRGDMRNTEQYKLAPSGWSNITIPGAFMPFTASVPDTNAAIRVSGQVVLLNVLSTFNGANSGYSYFGSIVIP